MAQLPKTPIILITGSLGVGKTTLLRRIIDSASPAPEDSSPGARSQLAAAGGSGEYVSGRRPPPARLAVLMNEFGELAVDSRVVSGRNIDIIELAGGCVCCSMTGEFEAAVSEIIETISPDFIVVEATGVAESDALVLEVEENLPQVRLDSVICIVDAYLGTRHPHVGYTSRTQIASADIILINKVDLVTAKEAGAVEAETRKYNDRAQLLRTVNCGIDTDLLLQISGIGYQRSDEKGFIRYPASDTRYPATGPPGPQPAHVLQSFVWTTGQPVDREKFDLLVGQLPQELIRAKGFVHFEDGGRLFNYVAGRVDFEEFEVDRTELVFIGPGLDRLRTEIEGGLEGCIFSREDAKRGV